MYPKYCWFCFQEVSQTNLAAREFLPAVRKSLEFTPGSLNLLMHPNRMAQLRSVSSPH